LKDELNVLKGRLVMAERNAASNEAQKKSLLQDKSDMQREVSWRSILLFTQMGGGLQCFCGFLIKFLDSVD